MKSLYSAINYWNALIYGPIFTTIVFQFMLYISTIKKAFDSFSLVKLVSKFCTYGLLQTVANGDILFFNNRKQQVCINNIKSNTARLSSGVLQSTISRTHFIVCKSFIQ